MLAVMGCKRTVRVFVEGSRGTGHITQSDRWGGVCVGGEEGSEGGMWGFEGREKEKGRGC